MASLVLPFLLAGAGLALDVNAWMGQKKDLQGIADAAAIAGARELYLANASASQIRSVAEATASANRNAAGKPIAVTAKLGQDGASVEVKATQTGQSYFADIFMGGPPTISANATARAMGGGRICVIGLDEVSDETIYTTKKGEMLANQCGVYSNSVNEDGIVASGSSLITAELICSAGGVDGAKSHFDPGFVTDCPKIPDPLAQRQPPSYGGCEHNNRSIKGGSTNETIYPGVYCGGLEIKAATVRMEPGIYVIKDGAFKVAANAEVTGENVSIFLVGDASVFSTESNSTMHLTAPKDGEMAGILFFEDRNAPLLREHTIRSNNARVLLGTFYMPRGRLVVRTSKPIADQSAYTAIVVNQLKVDLNSRLVINADYDATDIPVPEGIGPVGGNIVLTQ